MNAQTTAKQTSKMSQIGKTRYMVPVSYTHLTLPTILRV